MNGLKTLISKLLNIDLKAFDILPTQNPKEIKIVGIPFDFNSGSHSNLKRKILNKSIQSVLTAEYKLDHIEYSKSSNGQLFYSMIGKREIVKKSRMAMLQPFNDSNSSHVNKYVALIGQHTNNKKSQIANLQPFNEDKSSFNNNYVGLTSQHVRNKKSRKNNLDL